MKISPYVLAIAMLACVVAAGNIVGLDNVQVTGDVAVGGNVQVGTSTIIGSPPAQLWSISDGTGNNAIAASNYTSSVGTTAIRLTRGRGTRASPVHLNTNDGNGIAWYAYDSNNAKIEQAEIRVSQDLGLGVSAAPAYFSLFMQNPSGTLVEMWRWDQYGHMGSMYGGPWTLSQVTSCGTGASIATKSYDAGGHVVVGTGDTGCTLTFLNDWSANLAHGFNPMCDIWIEGAAWPSTVSWTQTFTQIIVTDAGGNLAGKDLYWDCRGYGN